eukprot:1414931-Prymnesium_polylepis.1
MRGGEFDPTLSSTLGVPAHIPGSIRARRHRGAVSSVMGGWLPLLPRHGRRPLSVQVYLPHEAQVGGAQ